MSKCQGCLQRLCRKHPLFDHGERAAKLQSLAKESQKASITALLQQQIDKLEAEKRGTSNDDNDAYKTEMHAERQKAHKRKSSAVNVDSGKAAKYANSSLNPAVLSMMIDNSDEGSGSSSDSDSDSEQRGKKDRKDKKKKHKKKDSKSSKKSKKSKKEDRKDDKKSKHKSRKHRKEDSGGSSSSSGSDSD